MMTANPIRTDGSNPFAHATMRDRLPDIIRELQARHDFAPVITAALDDLHDRMKDNARIRLPQHPAPDADLWRQVFEERPEERWLDAEWFFAETYFFRQINEAVRYWQTGRDPYAPMKQDDLQRESVRAQIEDGLALEGNAETRLAALLALTLWGNRGDLSHAEAMQQGADVADDDLLVDERDDAIRQLLADSGMVHYVTDNFGAELAMDLLLVGHEIPVVLHVKMHPTYVSDATAADVRHILDYFAARAAPATAARLSAAMDSGRLRVVPDFYWNSSHFLRAMPVRVREAWQTARLVILKGDANYRRAVNDTVYSVDTPLGQVVDYVPAPLVCLRTLKSDPVLGSTGGGQMNSTAPTTAGA